MFRSCLKTGKNGMLLIMALAILFILTLLAGSLIFLSQSSLIYVIRAQRENLEEQAIDVAKITIGKQLQGPMPSPDPAQDNWNDVIRDYSKVSLPDKDSKTPLPSPSPFTVQPENNKKFDLNGEIMTRKIPDTAGVDTDDVPHVGYQNSDDFPKLNGVSIPPWHSLAYVSDNRENKYQMMFSGAFPFGVYAPKGNINLWSAKGYYNPTIKNMKKKMEQKTHIFRRSGKSLRKRKYYR